MSIKTAMPRRLTVIEGPGVQAIQILVVRIKIAWKVLNAQTCRTSAHKQRVMQINLFLGNSETCFFRIALYLWKVQASIALKKNPKNSSIISFFSFWNQYSVWLPDTVLDVPSDSSKTNLLGIGVNSNAAAQEQWIILRVTPTPTHASSSLALEHVTNVLLKARQASVAADVVSVFYANWRWMCCKHYSLLALIESYSCTAEHDSNS